MTPNEIRVALETAVGVPEDALREAVEQATAFAPEVIAVAQSMANGCLPLPPQERLLRFGLHALSVARESSACPAFLALLRRPQFELMWLFGGDERGDRIARLLLGLFDGDDTAVRALIAERGVDESVRGGLFEALARLAWEGRASRQALTELLDRFDRENMAESGSWAWFGWQEAIMLLGLTDWIDRVKAAWAAGRDIPMYDRELDRDDWIERTRAAAENPDDPQRFIDDSITAYDDPTANLGWLADPDGGPTDPLSEDEFCWIDTAFWRRDGRLTLTFEGADGFLTALAVTPDREPLSAYLPKILGEAAEYDSPAHERYIAGLLERQLRSIAGRLERNDDVEPYIGDTGELSGALWAGGYFSGAKALENAWAKLRGKQSLAERLVVPIMALLPDVKTPGGSVLPLARRWELIRMLPNVIAANWAFFRDKYHPALGTHPERRVKVGRNDPCPCGSGKKYKRCCGAAV